MSEKKERTYINDNQQNLIKIVEYLGQDILIPKTAGELMDALGLSRDIIYRTIWNLKDRGWIEEHALGYRLSPTMTKFADQLRLSVTDTLRHYLPDCLKEDISKKE